jgi:hypothetical protein
MLSPVADGPRQGDFLRNHFSKEVRHIMTPGNFALVKEMGNSVADAVPIKRRIEILFLRPDQIDADPDQPRQVFESERGEGVRLSLNFFVDPPAARLPAWSATARAGAARRKSTKKV